MVTEALWPDFCAALSCVVMKMYLAFYLLAAHLVRGTRVCVNSPFTVTDFLVLLCHAIIRIDLLLQVERSRGTTGNEASVWV